MKRDSFSQQKAQLDKPERERLEDIVTQMRERVEDNVRFQLTQRDLDSRPERIDELDTETGQLVEAIDLEATDGESWSEALDKYVTGVGYTIVNRLTALRCMEVREFIDEEVTVFKQNGLTPAAETLVQEEFLLEDEAILEAYHNICDKFAEEIEILFDRSSAYSLIDPDDDTFEELCEMLGSVPSRIWRADDVLGWVYEYYNVKLLDDLRRKGNREGLESEDVPPANQFYTPHWVVRMLTDNSLGKLYLEHTGELQDVVKTQEAFSPDERKNRPLSPDESPDISDFCTYLVPSDEEGEPTEFEHPEELRVIDPACGSGHFLLYAFDILERIWRAETDLAEEEIPQKILQHNIYGVDLDMRACQLAAFNLYLKGRTRAEAEGVSEFDMPQVGVVCADAKVADVDGVETVFNEVAGDDPKIEDALRRILDVFEGVHGLGSLLDVRGTLGDLFEDDSGKDGIQITLDDDPTVDHTLGQILHSLRKAVEKHQDESSFLAHDLRSFIRLLDILAQNYDVALMNPPYGSKGRMPREVQNYIESNYQYYPNYYVSFFEVCNRLSKQGGRVGMIVPRTFMFLSSFEDFRADFVGDQGGFDFLAEFGNGVLDNATVHTAGTVVRSSPEQQQGSFFRLYDVPGSEKESVFIDVISEKDMNIQRQFNVDLATFADVSRTPICYSTPSPVRDLYDTNVLLDAEHAGVEAQSTFTAIPGIQTSNNTRFLRDHWETANTEGFSPLTKGGENAWITPQVTKMVQWEKDGSLIRRSSPSIRVRNEDFYGEPGLTWNLIKQTGRRFGFYPGGLFSVNGLMLFPRGDTSLWSTMAVLNSDLYHSLFLSQTIERNWNPGEIGAVPWIGELVNSNEFERLSKEQYEVVLSQRSAEIVSPYYIAPSLYPDPDVEYFYDHQHSRIAKDRYEINRSKITEKLSIQAAAREAQKNKLQKQSRLESISTAVNQALYDAVGIETETQKQIREEIFLRTSESPEDREVADLDSVPELSKKIDQEVKDLIHHFALEVIQHEPDGIITLHGTNDQAGMLDCIVQRFNHVYGEYAENRLVEVDEILGTKSAVGEAYPNLRKFINYDLFDYHIDKMENTPILWKLTTERLIADSTGEGFACFVDYHSLDSGLLDRLANQYLDPRKVELREHRNATDRRRGDDSLSASEQAKAAEQYERCASGLNQISAFEDVLQDLGSTNERDFEDRDRQLVEELAPKITVFREETEDRIDTLAELRDRNSEAWFKNTFSDNFWNAVDEWRDEWIDALGEVERACEEYAKPTNQSVEAHLADLFDYVNWRLKGSDHYSSTGILFMTYYFEREGAELLDDDGKPFDKLTQDEHLVASLATGLDDPSIVNKEFLESIANDEDINDIDNLPPLAEFKALAEEIDARCQTIDKQVPSDWTDRALSEITTAGYQPNREHGVKVNITPLSEVKIVPGIVDKEVL